MINSAHKHAHAQVKRTRSLITLYCFSKNILIAFWNVTFIFLTTAEDTPRSGSLTESSLFTTNANAPPSSFPLASSRVGSFPTVHVVLEHLIHFPFFLSSESHLATIATPSSPSPVAATTVTVSRNRSPALRRNQSFPVYSHEVTTTSSFASSSDSALTFLGPVPAIEGRVVVVVVR